MDQGRLRRFVRFAAAQAPRNSESGLVGFGKLQIGMALLLAQVCPKRAFATFQHCPRFSLNLGRVVIAKNVRVLLPVVLQHRQGKGGFDDVKQAGRDPYNSGVALPSFRVVAEPRYVPVIVRFEVGPVFK